MSDDEINRAAFFSDHFRNRIKYCQEVLETLLIKEEDEDEIYFINSMLDSMEQLSLQYKFKPIPQYVAEEIADCELYIYSRSMTKDIEDILIDEAEKIEIYEKKWKEMFEKIDEMWDANIAEQEIKLYILNIILEYFPDTEPNFADVISLSIFELATRNKNVRIALSNDQINNLKKEIFNGDNLSCGICLEDFQNEEVIVLHCYGSHKYHQNCIIPWLKKSVFCPSCKFDLREK